MLADSNILILSDRARVGRARPDPGAAGHRGGAPPPDPPGPAHADRPRRRDRRGARGASFLRAGRLRRRGDQPLSRLRDARSSCASENGLPLDGLRGAEELHQGDRQGHPEGDVQDGHLDLPVLLRRADLRRGRPVERASSRSISPAPRPRSRASACAEIAEEAVRRHARRLWRQPDLPRPCSMSAATTPSACAARTMPGRRTASPSCSTRCAATLPDEYEAFAASINEQSERLLTIRGLMEFKSAETADPARGGRARGRDRQALRHRRDELRLDQPRGAHHAGHRHEPHRRQVEHRRGRRGDRPLQAAAERRFDALGDQAGGVGPVRRHRRVPGQRRRPADQDGAGRQARRGRPAARPQGRQEHRRACATRRRASA